MSLILLVALYNTIVYLCILRITKPLIILIYFAIFACSVVELTKIVFHLFFESEDDTLTETAELLFYAAGLSRELLAIVVVMTAYQLTISLQLICEDFKVIGAIKRKRWLW